MQWTTVASIVHSASGSINVDEKFMTQSVHDSSPAGVMCGELSYRIMWNNTFVSGILLLLGWPYIVDGGFANSQSDGQDVAFVVLSQSNAFNARKAKEFRIDLNQQANKLSWQAPKQYCLHEDFIEIGGWTVFPLLEWILEKHQNDVNWLLVCAEGTKVKLKELVTTLGKFNSTQDWFLGRALQDAEATIIHHFAFHDDPGQFTYPDFAAGFALSIPLVKKLAIRRQSYVNNLQFSIDAQHEFALFVWDNGKGIELTDVPEFCIDENHQCATYYAASKMDMCGNPASNIFFAIKSCKKFEDRVSVILRTWANNGLDFKFFTDSLNDTYPRIDLRIPNTERGHCSKTLGIINHVVKGKAHENLSWLVITDDDTLLSVPRLMKLMSCFNPSEPIALGERYGSRSASQHGYDYITGGGGMVFSMVALRQLVESGICVCPSDDTPDDMFLGICFQRLAIPIIHSPHFHQARPSDYPREVLQHQEPVSFHKFWMIDPIEEYAKWLNTSEPPVHRQHTEL